MVNLLTYDPTAICSLQRWGFESMVPLDFDESINPRALWKYVSPRMAIEVEPFGSHFVARTKWLWLDHPRERAFIGHTAVHALGNLLMAMHEDVFTFTDEERDPLLLAVITFSSGFPSSV